MLQNVSIGGVGHFFRHTNSSIQYFPKRFELEIVLSMYLRPKKIQIITATLIHGGRTQFKKINEKLPISEGSEGSGPTFLRVQKLSKNRFFQKSSNFTTDVMGV